MTFGYVAALAARGLDTLSLLDWGGGIGHYYVLARALLPGVGIDYHCKDVPLFTEYGRQLFPDQHFYADESCLAQHYDLVVASTSLHYAENWRDPFGKLAQATMSYLYVAQLPTVQRAKSFVFIQRPYAYGYNTEYISWCLNRDEFLAQAAAAGLRLQREFVYGHVPMIRQAPEPGEYRGYLFAPARHN